MSNRHDAPEVTCLLRITCVSNVFPGNNVQCLKAATRLITGDSSVKTRV